MLKTNKQTNSQTKTFFFFLIVSEITKSMGAVIDIDSEPGRGSTFVVSQICFPVARGDEILAAQQTPEDKWTPSSASQVHIMLVEDNYFNQTIFQKILTDCGFKCTVVSDGHPAVEMWSSKPHGFFTLILMDLQMPFMGGVEATKRIRAIEQKRKSQQPIPIIGLTASIFPDDLNEAIDSGMNECLSKPLDKFMLQDTLWRVLNPPSAPFASMKNYLSNGDADSNASSRRNSEEMFSKNSRRSSSELFVQQQQHHQKQQLQQLQHQQLQQQLRETQAAERESNLLLGPRSSSMTRVESSEHIINFSIQQQQQQTQQNPSPLILSQNSQGKVPEENRSLAPTPSFIEQQTTTTPIPVNDTVFIQQQQQHHQFQQQIGENSNLTLNVNASNSTQTQLTAANNVRNRKRTISDTFVSNQNQDEMEDVQSDSNKRSKTKT